MKKEMFCLLLLSSLLLPTLCLSQNIFEPVIRRMYDLGILNAFLLFMFAAIFFAVLNKSKVLGESVAINAIVSFIVSFFIFIAPIIIGVNLLPNISLFFLQSASILLFVFMALLLSSFFYPDLPQMLAKQFVRRTTLWAMLGLGAALFVTSGLVSSFWRIGGGDAATGVSSDVIVIAAGLVLFVVFLMIASAATRGGG